MSHPTNKRERFSIGDLKGKKRSEGMWVRSIFRGTEEERKKFLDKDRRLRRDTTKLCSCEMCGNPRRLRGEITVQERRYLGL